MSLFDEDKPVKKLAHEIGSDLSLISVEELKARIVILKAETERLEAEIDAKTSSRSVAENLFRK